MDEWKQRWFQSNKCWWGGWSVCVCRGGVGVGDAARGSQVDLPELWSALPFLTQISSCTPQFRSPPGKTMQFVWATPRWRKQKRHGNAFKHDGRSRQKNHREGWEEHGYKDADRDWMVCGWPVFKSIYTVIISSYRSLSSNTKQLLWI